MSSREPNKLTVLVVDDNYNFNRVLTKHLQYSGDYEVLNAYTVEEFKKHASSADVVVLDIRLPDRDGASINPWGGLVGLNDMIAEPANSKLECLSRAIIRSVNSEKDARRVSIDIPPHHIWLSVDAPLSELMAALQELAAQVSGGD